VIGSYPRPVKAATAWRSALSFPVSPYEGQGHAGQHPCINPNSTDAVTRAIDGAMAPSHLPGGPEIYCRTLPEGPPGIESQHDADSVITPLCRTIREAESAAAAFVIACFSDPGPFSVHEVTAKPVFGIAECGILTALTIGHRFGVISILDRSVPRHLRYIAAMGVGERL
jgi:Asp/Glu/hydantoin racemase